MARCTSSLPQVWIDGGSVRFLLHLERHLGGPGLMPPSSTYHRFAVGLDGGKMSSSNPKSTLLTDDATTIERKIKRAYSGGQPTVEEHRRLGGDVDRDVPFQYLSYFFEEDDRALADLAEAYRNGRLLAGGDEASLHRCGPCMVPGPSGEPGPDRPSHTRIPC